MYISKQRIFVKNFVVTAMAFMLAANLGASDANQGAYKVEDAWIANMQETLSFSAQLKPYKAWIQETDRIPMTIEEILSYEFLSQVIDNRGEPPDLMQLMTLEGTNNVGGRIIVENAQIFYLKPSGVALDLFESGTITVANGDEICITIEGILNLPNGPGNGTVTILGGTGRFESAEGAAIFRVSLNSDGKAVVTVEGYIITVGQTKEWQRNAYSNAYTD